jgi:hypothetical protein
MRRRPETQPNIGYPPQVRPAAKAADNTSEAAAAMDIRRAILTSFRSDLDVRNQVRGTLVVGDGERGPETTTAFLSSGQLDASRPRPG